MERWIAAALAAMMIAVLAGCTDDGYVAPGEGPDTLYTFGAPGALR